LLIIEQATLAPVRWGITGALSGGRLAPAPGQQAIHVTSRSGTERSPAERDGRDRVVLVGPCSRPNQVAGIRSQCVSGNGPQSARSAIGC